MRIPFLSSLILNCLNGLFVFSLCFSSNALLAQNTESWEAKSLSKDDARGANTLLVVARNAAALSKMLNGKALNDSTKIVVGTYKNKLAARSTFDAKTGNKTTVTTEQTLYLLTETVNGNISRLLPVVENAVTTVVSTATPKIIKIGDEEIEIPEVLSAKTEYIPQVQDTDDLLGPSATEAGKARVAEFANKIAQLYAESNTNDCIEHTDKQEAGDVEMQLCRVSSAAVTLIRRASNKAKSLAEEIKEKADTGKFEYDTKAPKSVTYEISNLGRVRKIVLSGFIRTKEESLSDEAKDPGFVSAWVVKIDSAGGDETNVKILKREADTKQNFKSLNFEMENN